MTGMGYYSTPKAHRRLREDFQERTFEPTHKGQVRVDKMGGGGRSRQKKRWCKKERQEAAMVCVAGWEGGR